MNSVLMENFGTNNIIVRCSCFDETVRVTNKFHEMGFLRTKNSERIANGEIVYRADEYWKHPYIDRKNEIHYYHSEYRFPDAHSSYEEVISFQEFINIFEETEDDDLELSDMISRVEEFLST